MTWERGSDRCSQPSSEAAIRPGLVTIATADPSGLAVTCGGEGRDAGVAGLGAAGGSAPSSYFGAALKPQSLVARTPRRTRVNYLSLYLYTRVALSRLLLSREVTVSPVGKQFFSVSVERAPTFTVHIPRCRHAREHMFFFVTCCGDIWLTYFSPIALRRATYSQLVQFSHEISIISNTLRPREFQFAIWTSRHFIQ